MPYYVVIHRKPGYKEEFIGFESAEGFERAEEQDEILLR